MTFDEMLDCLDVCDQTVGCNYCQRAWWGRHATDPFENFHADDCPLKGRRDVHAAWGINYPAADEMTRHVRELNEEG